MKLLCGALVYIRIHVVVVVLFLYRVPKCLSVVCSLSRGYTAQFLRYLDKNFMEGVFQYYLELLFWKIKKKQKKKKNSKKPLKTGFFFKKDAVCNGFSISLAF